jgi:hypothetical protein
MGVCVASTAKVEELVKTIVDLLNKLFKAKLGRQPLKLEVEEIQAEVPDETGPTEEVQERIGDQSMR